MIMRCKNCGRPISEDEQKNFSWSCYDCFKDYKSSKLRKGTAMQIVGIVGLLIVSLVIFGFSSIIRYVGGFYRPRGAVVFITGSIIAVIIPVLLIFFGTMLKREWSTILKVKPIEPQEVISIPPKNTIPAQKKFCPECGNKITDPNQKFCVNCGSELNS